MSHYLVNKAVRSLAVSALATIILVGSALTAPGTVLCLGPAHHCHLEAAAGANCNNNLLASPASAPRPRDGCPKGSRDFRLSVDSHRTDAMHAVAAAASPLFVISCLVEISSHPELSSAGFSATLQLHSAIVLRC